MKNKFALFTDLELQVLYEALTGAGTGATTLDLVIDVETERQERYETRLFTMTSDERLARAYSDERLARAYFHIQET